MRKSNLFYNGEGVEKNYSEALGWYMSSANQGIADAQYNVGLCYYYGNGVKQDYKEAMKWYELAAKKMSLWQKSYCGTVKKLWKRKQK